MDGMEIIGEAGVVTEDVAGDCSRTSWKHVLQIYKIASPKEYAEGRLIKVLFALHPRQWSLNQGAFVSPTRCQLTGAENPVLYCNMRTGENNALSKC